MSNPIAIDALRLPPSVGFDGRRLVARRVPRRLPHGSELPTRHGEPAPASRA